MVSTSSLAYWYMQVFLLLEDTLFPPQVEQVIHIEGRASRRG